MSTTGLVLPRWPTLRAWFWQRPEWWMLGISAVCWMLLLLAGKGNGSDHSHAHHQGTSWGSAWWHWSLMVGAMMLPLLTAQVRLVAHRSLWSRRHRSMALYLAGYCVPWLLFGAAAISAMSLLRVPIGWFELLVLAAAWQVTPWKKRALRACHRTDVLAPFGWRADLDCLRAGSRTAGACLLSCWALMLPCAAPGASLGWMAIATGVAFGERFRRRH